MITLEDIKKHMISFMSNYIIDKNNQSDEDEYYGPYDEDGYCSSYLLSEIKEFWKSFDTNSVDDFKYFVSGEWCGELDLDGGREYFITESNISKLCFEYIYDVLGWSLDDYQKIIFNSCDLTDYIEDEYDNIVIVRNDKIESVLNNKDEI